MQDEIDEQSQLQQYISKMVQDHWDATGQALLLSNIGARIKEAFPNSSTIMPEGLRAFLSGSSSVQIVQHPRIYQKVGAVPKGANVPPDPTKLLPEKQSSNFLTERIYFNKEFWKAFHTPLVGRRFVIVPTQQDPNCRIVDRADNKEEPGAYEILNSDLSMLAPEAPLSDKAQAKIRKINDWLARNDLSSDLFVDKGYTARRSTPPFATDRSEMTALALSKLDFSDQARIYIPLDIVIKMISGGK